MRREGVAGLSLLSAGGAIAVFAAGFAAGGASREHALGRSMVALHADLTRVEELAHDRPACPPSTIVREDTARLDALTMAVDRLAAGARDKAGRGPSAGAETAAAAPSGEEAIRALAHAQRTIDLALQSGHWTHDDARAVRQAFNTLDADGRAEVRRRLFAAVNEGSVKVDFRGALL